MSELALHFHWPPDFWRSMGWVELRLWLREMRRQRDRAAGVTPPETWRGSQNDPWWKAQRERNRRLRGG